jgi:hypothetical protein
LRQQQDSRIAAATALAITAAHIFMLVLTTALSSSSNYMSALTVKCVGYSTGTGAGTLCNNAIAVDARTSCSDYW